MKTHWLKLGSAALLALSVSCGGNSGNAAIGKTFNYGSAQPPTSTETSAISSAQTGVSASTDFSTAPTADKGFALIGMVSTLSGALGGFSVPGMPRQLDINGAARNAVQAAAFDTCATVAADNSSVTFNNCQLTDSGFNITLRGSVTVKSATGKVGWDVTMTLSGSDSTTSVSINDHAAGDLTVTSNSVKGNSTTEVSGSLSDSGQSLSFGLSLAALFDVTAQTSPSFCIAAPSSVEVKRVWTAHPSGQGADQLFADAGIKVSWSGCDQYTVAHSQ